MNRLAFYDLDGTLVASNIVRRYAFYARSLPSRARAALKFTKLVLGVPFFIGLDHYSRRRFNEVFYRQYRGMKEEWLRELSEAVFQKVIFPAIYPNAKRLVDTDREQGFRPVLVTGELDFVIEPVVRHFGFENRICNSLVFRDGIATGDVVPPLIAEGEKVAAMAKVSREYHAQPADSKAYSDSFSDVPMLAAVGRPTAVNPDRRLRTVAIERGWPVVDLKRGNHVHDYGKRSARKTAGV